MWGCRSEHRGGAPGGAVRRESQAVGSSTGSALTIWVDKCSSWFAAGNGKCGRSPQFSDTAIQFFRTIKNLFGLAADHGFFTVFVGLFRSGQGSPRLQHAVPPPALQVACLASADGLHLLADSTGIKFLGNGEWKCKKAWTRALASMLQATYRHGCPDAAGAAICVTSNNVRDAAVMP